MPIRVRLALKRAYLDGLLRLVHIVQVALCGAPHRLGEGEKMEAAFGPAFRFSSQ